ncbi:UvrD-helicase domain-containing protein [Candidatus Curtissbacteria bacterium]|nr:UvrD-helicase domain-containing protein [Candidatus Curtissbacteria bacterium]
MNILTNLDTYQAKAVEETDGPILILAGAGSGKTRVLTHKIAYLMENGIKGENILAVTFTNKAANEMKERVSRLIEGLDGGSLGKSEKHSSEVSAMLPFVGTYHSFCAKLLRVEGKFVGLSSGYLIFDSDDSLTLIKRIMKLLNIGTRFKPTSIANAISSAKGELVTVSAYSNISQTPFGSTVLQVYEKYQKELAAQNACDFDDLLMQTVKLFEMYPNILSKYSGKYRYVLVDEYQDVNTSQYKLTKQLASAYGNLTVVGDASQAIYSFRGADFRNILNFEQDFPSAKVFNLEKNYRSTQNILDVANSIISRNSSHPVLKLWTENDEGEKVSIFNASNEIDEANFIVDRVISSGLTYSSFAVLYRTNAQSRTVEEALLHANIPYRIYGGIRFYERKEVKDILAYLRVIENPKDRVSAARIEKLGKRRLEKFKELVKKIGKIEKVHRPIELIDDILNATQYLLLIDDGSEQGLQRVENVKELKSVASEFENLSTFLENVALMEGKVSPDKSFEAAGQFVTLMTIHAAKGLEFDIVFVIGMEEGLFPHARSMLDPQQIEEERRLAYVAMTRARQKLYLSYASRRLYFGSLSANMVSRFVTDIPEELISSV